MKGMFQALRDSSSLRDTLLIAAPARVECD